MANRLLVIVALVSLGAATPAVAQPSSEWHYTQIGSLVGGAAFFGLTQAGAAACGIGCENDMSTGAILAITGLGVGLGTLTGFAADVFLGDGPPVFALSGGPIFSYMTMPSANMAGSARGAGGTVAFQLSRWFSVHGEYTAMHGTFTARPGSIDPTVRANVVPATSRSAGWSRGVEHIRSQWMFSEMIGIHPWTWSRVRMEFLGGVAVQAKETFSYYDAGPGTYKVLNFASPDLSALVGANAEITVVRHLAVVPMIRYYAGHSPSPSMTYAVSARYRF